MSLAAATAHTAPVNQTGVMSNADVMSKRLVHVARIEAISDPSSGASAAGIKTRNSEATAAIKPHAGYAKAVAFAFKPFCFGCAF